MIGVPAVTVEPDTCTALAPSAAALAAAMISAGDFEATPLPEEEPPQPASAVTATTSDRPATEVSRQRTAATLAEPPAIGRRVAAVVERWCFAHSNRLPARIAYAHAIDNSSASSRLRFRMRAARRSTRAREPKPMGTPAIVE